MRCVCAIQDTSLGVMSRILGFKGPMKDQERDKQHPPRLQASTVLSLTACGKIVRWRQARRRDSPRAANTTPPSQRPAADCSPGDQCSDQPALHGVLSKTNQPWSRQN